MSGVQGKDNNAVDSWKRILQMGKERKIPNKPRSSPTFSEVWWQAREYTMKQLYTSGRIRGHKK